jgi:hypothetical protein
VVPTGTYAALVRPAVDRVYIAARAAARPRVRAVVDAAGLRPGFIVSFYFGLLARPMPADSFAAATTYSGSDMTEELEDGVAVVDDAGTWSVTPAGRDLGAAIQLAIGAGAEELWAARLDSLPRLADLVGRLLDAGAASGGPAFAAMAPVYEPPGASPAVMVTTRLGALRHHRADAHRAAWAAAGLTLPELLALPAGGVRQEIEDDTDRRDAPIYAALTDDERVELLALLAALPG